MNVFIFGLGYAARASARQLHESFGSACLVSGTVRGPERAEALALEGLDTHVFDGSKPGETLEEPLAGASHVVLSVPPGEESDPVLIHHGADLMRSRALRWLCYFSTAGVYGDHDGAWIDETVQPSPRNERSRRRLAAEESWRAFAAEKGVSLLILRLAGIYGPGRSSLDRLKAGTARRIVKPGQVFNRIHVADIARITAKAARVKLAGTFSLADDEPAAPEDPTTFAASLLNMAPPPQQIFEAAEMTAMTRSFYAENKRVSNAAIKRALGIELKYPTYRQGLGAIFEGLN